MACREIITGVNNHISASYQLKQRFAVHAMWDGFDVDFRVDSDKRLSRGERLIQSDRSGLMHNLALQVSDIHRVAVADSQSAHTAGSQVQRGGRAQAASADNKRMRL